MRIRFLLGPAGSGKTYQCLCAIREELRARPEGAPLVFLAPKQATFQLERQLLAGDELEGYTRLRILSFQRLARFVFERLGLAEPRLLAEEGRVMVLRAILNESHYSLGVFQSTARRQGFAEEVSRQIREFQNYRYTPERLREMAAKLGSGERGAGKLRDLALIYEQYLDWLGVHELQDGDALLTAAAEALEKAAPGGVEIAGLWFDGFAQLTPQERALLMAVLGFAGEATLAFCLDEPGGGRGPLSHWNLVEGTFNRCAAEIGARFGKEQLEFARLRRDASRGRFAGNGVLAWLEEHWSGSGAGGMDGAELSGALELVECADPEAEAVFCAREILRHVRGGGRYRETAVLPRSLDNCYPDVFRRVFTRYGIPAFFDQREGVAHHPLAELTRGALRTLAFNWRHADWFGALKSGLFPTVGDELDNLENEALARGWEGKVWENGMKIRGDAGLEESCNRLRLRLVAPVLKLGRKLGGEPDGREITGALRGLWEELRVRDQLEKWSSGDGDAIHRTVWEQMTEWVANIELAFPEQRLSLREWLSIIEAGLASLTVGQIPPVLDQVLIGAVDRSRNPDLKVVFVPGANEGVFPALPGRDCLLTERDRERLAEQGCELASLPGLQLAGEQFYGYIACTRAREKLVLTFAQSSVEGKALNPSRFIGQLQRLFPGLEPRKWVLPEELSECEHVSELLPRLAGGGALPELFAGAVPEPLSAFVQRLAALRLPSAEERLDPAVAAQLYTRELRTSVSALEKFAACPFQFFVSRGLKIQERQTFQLDVREQGDFQHQVLEEFHAGVMEEKLRWRDLQPEEAKRRIRAAAAKILPGFRDGLLDATDQNRFTAEVHTQALEEFIGMVIEWFKSNRFDPVCVEVPFGPGPDDKLPGWRISLGENAPDLLLRGRIDRLDLFREGGRAYCIIMDYKSAKKRPDKTLLHHGIQQQLPAYLLAVTRMEESRAFFGAEELAGAGVFFLPLKPGYDNGKTRREVLEGDTADLRRKAFKHYGLFDLGLIEHLDEEWRENSSHQFAHRVRKDGAPVKGSFEALSREQFEAVLERTEQLLIEAGRRIYSGEVGAHPYKHGSKSACDHCDFQPVCRFDPWTQDFNQLSAAPE